MTRAFAFAVLLFPSPFQSSIKFKPGREGGFSFCVVLHVPLNPVRYKICLSGIIITIIGGGMAKAGVGFSPG